MAPTTGERVAANVAALRQERGLTTRALEKRLTELGHKIGHTSITKIEQNKRSVSVEDLVALALALGVNTNRLLMSARADAADVQLTPAVAPAAFQAWAWADGNQPLLAAAYGGPDTRWSEVMYDFHHHARPVDKRVREAHEAMRAAREVITRIDTLLTYLIETGQGVLQYRDKDGSNPTPVEPRGFARARDVADVMSKLDGDPITALQRARDRMNAEIEQLLRAAGRTAQPWTPPSLDDLDLSPGDRSALGVVLAADTLEAMRQQHMGTGRLPGDPAMSSDDLEAKLAETAVTFTPEEVDAKIIATAAAMLVDPDNFAALKKLWAETGKPPGDRDDDDEPDGGDSGER
jgi:transcriptional regulator with XRE-family HTH domain